MTRAVGGTLNTYKYLYSFSPFTTIMVCSLICLYTLIANIANNMDPDQTAPVGSGFKVFAWTVKNFLSAFEYIQQM